MLLLLLPQTPLRSCIVLFGWLLDWYISRFLRFASQGSLFQYSMQHSNHLRRLRQRWRQPLPQQQQRHVPLINSNTPEHRKVTVRLGNIHGIDDIDGIDGIVIILLLYSSWYWWYWWYWWYCNYSTALYSSWYWWYWWYWWYCNYSIALFIMISMVLMVL